MQSTPAAHRVLAVPALVVWRVPVSVSKANLDAFLEARGRPNLSFWSSIWPLRPEDPWEELSRVLVEPEPWHILPRHFCLRCLADLSRGVSKAGG